MPWSLIPVVFVTMLLMLPSCASGPSSQIIDSTDQTVRAFAKTFPFPLEVRDGSCSLQAELITLRAFAILGEGFVPGEEVSTDSESGGEVLTGLKTVSNEGKLPIILVDPGVKGTRG